MKAQRINTDKKHAHGIKNNPSNLETIINENSGSCIKYAVYSPSDLSSRFKQVVDENNPVVVISPVRRSKRQESFQNHQSTPSSLKPMMPMLLDSLSELDQKIDYAWVPNTAIKDLQSPFQ